MSANVRDIEVLQRARVALMTFIESIHAALEGLEIEMQRSTQWIEQDRPHYWTGQIRRAFDKVSQARTAYETCRMRTVAGRTPSCIEEKQALAAAKRRLQHCQEQTERVRKWANSIRREGDDFRARMSSLRRAVDQDAPKAIAQLERMLTALEGYAEIHRPPTDAEPSGEDD